MWSDTREEEEAAQSSLSNSSSVIQTKQEVDHSPQVIFQNVNKQGSEGVA